MDKIISMTDVAVSFKETKALNGLTFEVKENEIFGFLGPSGAGKTTTIKTLTRQLRAEKGDIFLFGEELRGLSREVYEEIGILTDNSGLYERMTVFENLKLFADLKGLGSNAVLEVLDRVGLLEDKKKLAKNLSRGMKQRVMLARAVLHKPKLLFLDEPTSALDPGTSKAIHEMLFDLNGTGTTIFLTTHDMVEADKLCNRVAFLNQGKIVELGNPGELKLKYADNSIVLTLMDGTILEEEKTKDGMMRLAESLNGREIAMVHSSEPTLEDIFLKVTGRKLA